MVIYLTDTYGWDGVMYNHKDRDGKTAEMYAMELNDKDILNYLTQYRSSKDPGLCEISCIVL